MSVGNVYKVTWLFGRGAGIWMDAEAGTEEHGFSAPTEWTGPIIWLSYLPAAQPQ